MHGFVIIHVVAQVIVIYIFACDVSAVNRNNCRITGLNRINTDYRNELVVLVLASLDMFYVIDNGFDFFSKSINIGIWIKCNEFITGNAGYNRIFVCLLQNGCQSNQNAVTGTVAIVLINQLELIEV